MKRLAVLTLALAAMAIGAVGRPAATAGLGPSVTIHVAGNQSFFWDNRRLRYLVIASDPGKGDTLAGTIADEHVTVFSGYLPSGYDELTRSIVDPSKMTDHSKGRKLVGSNDCVLCHEERHDTVIPGYLTISQHYAGSDDAGDQLAARIIEGSKGNWGEIPMTPHPNLSMDDARAMVAYILSFGDSSGRKERLPVLGVVTTDKHEQGRSDTAMGRVVAGRYVLAAGYQGREETDQSKGQAWSALKLRWPLLTPEDAADSRNIAFIQDPKLGDVAVAGTSRAFLKFAHIDLTDIRAVTVAVGDWQRRWGGGRIELRLDGHRGRVIGQVTTDSSAPDPVVKLLPVLIPPLDGFHDLYVVVTLDSSNDPNDTGDRTGIAITALRFHPEGSLQGQ